MLRRKGIPGAACWTRGGENWAERAGRTLQRICLFRLGSATGISSPKEHLVFRYHSCSQADTVFFVSCTASKKKMTGSAVPG